MGRDTPEARLLQAPSSRTGASTTSRSNPLQRLAARGGSGTERQPELAPAAPCERAPLPAGRTVTCQAGWRRSPEQPAAGAGPGRRAQAPPPPPRTALPFPPLRHDVTSEARAATFSEGAVPAGGAVLAACSLRISALLPLLKMSAVASAAGGGGAAPARRGAAPLCCRRWRAAAVRERALRPRRSPPGSRPPSAEPSCAGGSC